MSAELGVMVASAAIGLVGVAFASRGANHTQAKLERGLGRDRLIGAMAAIDRAVFRAAEPAVLGDAKASGSTKRAP